MKEYNASNIRIFKNLDAVRKRPGMYIGDTEDFSGLHRMVFEVIDNSIDESLAGYCDFIKIILHDSNYVTIFDNGRGLPIDYYKDTKKTAAEIIMTVLHAGAKFDKKSYQLSGGLHGVGVSVVNALSKNLSLKIFRSGFIYEQKYSYGKPINDLKIIGHTDKRGTEIRFSPDFSIFKKSHFSYGRLLFKCRELSFLNSNVKIKLVDKRSGLFKSDILFNKGGLKAFVKFLNKKKSLIHNDIIFFSSKKDNISINVAIQWVDSLKENILCYTNNIYQKDGGSHLNGFKNAVIKVFKNYIDKQIIKSKDNIYVQGDDVKDGLVAVLSLYMNNPKFSSQIKDKLVSIEAKQVVDYIISVKLKNFLYENPSISKFISNKIVSAARAREAAKKAKELSKKKNVFNYFNLCTKLSDCQERNSALAELFLVEGDSAGGSAKQARDRRTQAILPLKGKILNIERAGFDKILSSSEIVSIISALGCGVYSDYDPSKLRYHKIIFMTDADVDGSHIRTLLMTFFYRRMPILIRNKHIFISKPPLYRVKYGKDIFYIKDKIDFNDFIFNTVSIKLKKIFDFSSLDHALKLYRKVITIIDSMSFKFPKIFFKKLLFFDKIFTFKEKMSKNSISEFKFFFNKVIGFDKSCFLKDIYLSSYSLNVIFTRYGVPREYKLDLSFFSSDDYKIFCKCYIELILLFKKKEKILFDNNFYDFYNFDKLVNTIISKTISKYSIQHYKGLGEMNPGQLWDTTMDPKNRNLQLVKIKDAVSADSIFFSLMGDDIEKRKKFIEKHAYFFSDFTI